MNKIKKGLEKEGAEELVSGQGKFVSSFTKEEVRLQGGSKEGTTAFAAQQVNVACGAIQSSLVNLVKVGNSINSLNESPVLSKAHLHVSGTEAHVDTNARCASVSEKFLEGVCAMGFDGVQSSTPKSPRVEQPLKPSFMGDSKGGACSLSRVNNSLSKSNSGRKFLISKGCEGDLGKKMCGVDRDGEEHIEVDDHQTPDRVRHLRALWEQGGRTIQRRWRSKGARDRYTPGIDTQPGHVL